MTRNGVAAALPLCLAMALPVSPGRAQEAERHVGRYRVAQKSIALPPGQWRILGDEAYPVDGRREGVSSVVRSVVLGEVADGQARALVVIRTNQAAAPGGFGATEDCERSELYLAQFDTPEESPIAACTFIGHVLHDAGPEADPAWREAVAAIAQDRLAAPATWLSVGYRFADDDDILDVRYFLDPDPLGLPAPLPLVAPEPEPGMWGKVSGWVDPFGYWEVERDARWTASAWAPANAANDPRRAEVIDQLTEWAAEIRPSMRQGFKGRLVDALEWPTPWIIAFGLTPERDGLAIIEESSPVPLETLALWKAATYRVLDIAVTILTPLAITGSVEVAGAITIVNEAAETSLYYYNELLWGAYGVEGGPFAVYTELPPAGIGG